MLTHSTEFNLSSYCTSPVTLRLSGISELCLNGLSGVCLIGWLRHLGGFHHVFESLAEDSVAGNSLPGSFRTQTGIRIFTSSTCNCYPIFTKIWMFLQILPTFPETLVMKILSGSSIYFMRTDRQTGIANRCIFATLLANAINQIEWFCFLRLVVRNAISPVLA